MPIYEYHCVECENPFEVFVRSTATARSPECPNCGSEHVEKGVSTIARVDTSSSSEAASFCAPSG